MSEELKPCPFCGGAADPTGWYADMQTDPRIAASLRARYAKESTQ